MKRFLLLFFILFEVYGASAQDIGVTAITAPVSGCNLSATENVTIRIFNYGSNVATPFNVSYTINGGAPVTEVINAVILSNSTYTYTFTTQANLSIGGTYTFTANTSLAGDINPTNDAVTNYVVVADAPSAGGTVTGGTSVCTGSNSGSVALAGYTGNIQRWEYSTDNGNTWINISNTSATQSYLNLTVKTLYRAVTQNGTCPPSTSTPDSITINSATIGGSVSGTATVCSGSNGATMTLSGHNGTVQNWEFSTNAGVTWTPIANTALTQAYSNLTQTTRYRAVVKNGACPSANSNAAIITVSPPTVAGSLAGSDTVCSGSNSGSILVTGNTGSVLRWEYSTNNGVSWINIANTTTTQTYSNLTASRLYRALVRSGGCPQRYSDTAQIVVDPPTIAGSLTGGSTVCATSNSGTLTLTGATGSVLNWESSTDGGNTWSLMSNTSTTFNYNNLATSTVYRALVKNGNCNSAYSGTTTVTVDSASQAGPVSSSAVVCSGSNGATLTMGTFTGNILGWVSSTDGGVTWNTIANTTTAQTYNNLTSTTAYATVVKNGVCPNDTSAPATITVDSVTAGGTVGGSTTVCSGSNSGSVTLTGHTGNILNWESSTDGGFTWIAIANATTSQAYNNITTTTKYRAVVQSGVCPQAYSSVATITVDPTGSGGTVFGGTTVCAAGNSGSLSLLTYTGSITDWQTSTDNGVSWISTGNTSASFNYLNLTTTTWYRAIVVSGVCPGDTSAVGVMTVDSVSLGGVVASNDTVCYGSNSGAVNLTGYRGNVTGWEVSTDNGNTWFSISNSTVSQGYFNLTTTTSYRANVKNGVCPAASSLPATITVDPRSNAGTISGGTTVCAAGNSGTLTLAGYTGSINDWQTSTDNGVTWAPTGNTSSSLNYLNLTSTTWFRTIVTNSVCPADTGDVVSVVVDSVSVGGTVLSSDTVCSGSNSDTLNLTGYRGTITAWELSIDGTNWSAISNTTSSLIYLDLNTTTSYRAIVKNGVCPAENSSSATITVSPSSIAGSISGASQGCSGQLSGSLVSSGNIGSVVDWLSSTDNGVTWLNASNANDTLTFTNLAVTTMYKAIVQNGTCTPDTSSSVTVTVFPRPVASFTADTVCFGASTRFTNMSTVSSGFIQMYQWDFGDNDASVANAPVHTYMTADTFAVALVAISDKGCSDTASSFVFVHSLPIATISAIGANPFCEGSSVQLVGPTGPYGYVWSNGDLNSSVYINTSTVVTLTVTDTLTGCISADSIQTIMQLRPVADAGRDTSVSLGNQITLQGTGGTSFSWTPVETLSNSEISNPVADPLQTTTYSLIVRDDLGCSDTDEVVVTVVMDFVFTPSNLITPNGDGFNDTWYIENIDLYTDNKVSVFNRNGQLIFSADSYKNDWDATYNGQRITDGTYYYVITFGSSDKVFKGAITVLTEESTN